MFTALSLADVVVLQTSAQFLTFFRRFFLSFGRLSCGAATLFYFLFFFFWGGGGCTDFRRPTFYWWKSIDPSERNKKKSATNLTEMEDENDKRTTMACDAVATDRRDENKNKNNQSQRNQKASVR